MRLQFARSNGSAKKPSVALTSVSIFRAQREIALITIEPPARGMAKRWRQLDQRQSVRQTTILALAGISPK